ncbi:2Fe-2S iron-sulfur cluster-binding protein [Legionella micdadei]|uniref:2Fe-2S iron-sulfur cluster-binding protein n=1 Tax=Legionella micdadei TaxID=451 RepID=UPI0032C4A1FC
MPKLSFNHHVCTSNEGESILECLIRNGIDYPHSCRSGVCQACLIKASDSPIDPKWQEGLPDTLKSQGYFLACQAKPLTDFNLKSPDKSECDQEAIIIEITPMTYNVIKVKLLTEHLDRWIPGQYLNFINTESICRSYSIANIPDKEGYIELHIKLQNSGVMSQWFREKATVDTAIHIRGLSESAIMLIQKKKPLTFYSLEQAPDLLLWWQLLKVLLPNNIKEKSY